MSQKLYKIYLKSAFCLKIPLKYRSGMTANTASIFCIVPDQQNKLRCFLVLFLVPLVQQWWDLHLRMDLVEMSRFGQRKYNNCKHD